MLGVSEGTIMGLMGWSNPAMTRRYAHLGDSIRRETASRIDGLLWAPMADGTGSAAAGQMDAG